MFVKRTIAKSAVRGASRRAAQQQRASLYAVSAVAAITVSVFTAIILPTHAAEGDAAKTPTSKPPSGATTKRSYLWLRAADALTLDPHATRDGFTVALLRQVYESLIRRGPNGKLEPGLAVAWEASGNGLTWRIRLRSGVRFHNGATLTSRDVVYSLMRARGPKTALASLLDGITSIQAESAEVVTITTRYADPLMPLRLAAIAIVNAEWSNANGMSRVVPLRAATLRNASQQTDSPPRVNGTGAFRMTARSKNHQTILVSNTDWWGAIAPGTAPLQRVIFRPITKNADRMAAFRKADAVFLQDVPVHKREVLRTAPNTVVRAGTDNRVVFLGLRLKSSQHVPETDWMTVKSAIAAIIDRTGLRGETLANQGLPTTVLVPSGFDGYSRPLDRIQPVDVSSVTRTLAAAGVDPGDITVTLTCPRQGHPDPIVICSKLADDIKRIGLKLTTVIVDRTSFYRRILDRKPTAFLFSLYDPTFDGADLFANLVLPNARWNATAIDQPEITAGVSALTAPSDRRTRKLQFTIIETQLRQTNAIIPLFSPTLSYAFKGGYEMSVDALDAPELSRLRKPPAPAGAEANAATGGLFE